MTKERRREIARNWARKNYSQNTEEVLQYHKEYWQNTTPERKQKRKEKKLQYTHTFRKKHPDSPQVYFKRSKEKWTEGINCKNPKIWKKAEHIAKTILEKMGYQDFFENTFKQFYFDIVFKKDNKYSVFQVTTLRQRAIKRKHIEMAKYFNWDFYVVHVKPTFTELYITKINLDIPPHQKTFCYSAINADKKMFLTPKDIAALN